MVKTEKEGEKDIMKIKISVDCGTYGFKEIYNGKQEITKALISLLDNTTEEIIVKKKPTQKAGQ